MLLKRKEAKNYGKKQMIEGVFEPGKKALIIEDVVTSGASIMETVDVDFLILYFFKLLLKFKELRKVGLVCENVLCVLNRQQGGADRLILDGITLRRFMLHNFI